MKFSSISPLFDNLQYLWPGHLIKKFVSHSTTCLIRCIKRYLVCLKWRIQFKPIHSHCYAGVKEFIELQTQAETIHRLLLSVRWEIVYSSTTVTEATVSSTSLSWVAKLLTKDKPPTTRRLEFHPCAIFSSLTLLFQPLNRNFLFHIQFNSIESNQ